MEIGFIATRTRSTSPLVIPPSRPPARLLERSTPPGPSTISSWAALPRRRRADRAGQFQITRTQRGPQRHLSTSGHEQQHREPVSQAA